MKQRIFTIQYFNKKNNEVATNIIESEDLERNNSMVPVVYQPKIDAWENFLREIHVHKEADNSFQITLVFQDEALRQQGVLDSVYKYIRKLKYKRIIDIGTFVFKDSRFFFEHIYSGRK